MNLYFLVEGRRTEMAVYPAWLSILVPELTQVHRPFDAVENNYYIVSGFGYPNILGHFSACVRDVDKFSEYDYLVICIDADERSVRKRVREIRDFLSRQSVFPKRARVKIIVQKKCIETWFIPNDDNQQGRGEPQLAPFLEFYDVFAKDPEKMDRPSKYRGSVGDFHVEYLGRLLDARGLFYSKRNPSAVCSPHYVQRLQERVERTDQMGTLRYFFNFCRDVRRECQGPPVPRPPRREPPGGRANQDDDVACPLVSGPEPPEDEQTAEAGAEEQMELAGPYPVIDEQQGAG